MCMLRRHPKKAARRDTTGRRIARISASVRQGARPLGKKQRFRRHAHEPQRQQGRVRRRGAAMSEAGLPGEVMELIFERLPTLSLLRFTAVCKQWREMIGARVAAAAGRPRPPPAADDWLLMVSDGLHLGKLSAYSPAWGRWHSIRLPVDSNNRFPFAVAAAGHLVCMSDRCFRKFGMYGRVAVCDPLLKLWHELPPLRSWGVIQGMAVDPATAAVKILATNFLDGNHGAFKLTCAELYDAAAGRWRIVAPPDPLAAADCGAVFCGARFLFLDPADGLFAFDLAREAWVRVSAAALPPAAHPRVHKKLVACDDCVFLLTVEEAGPARDLVVWGLSPAMKWDKAAKAPPAVARRLFEDDPGERCDDDEEDGGAAHCGVGECYDPPGGAPLHGYSSTRRWTASGEAHEDVPRVWAVALGGKSSAIFLKNSRVPQLLRLDLSKEGDERWRWVMCPHHVPLSARPFSFSL